MRSDLIPGKPCEHSGKEPFVRLPVQAELIRKGQVFK